MKKTLVVISAFFLFAGLTFGQTPQTQDKTKATTKTETKATAKPAEKDSKAGCEKSCTMKKSSCCDKKGEMKDTKAPEKK